MVFYAASLLVGALLVGAAVGTAGGTATVEQRAHAVATRLRCPVCQGLSVADSPSTTAREMRRQIEALLTDGLSEAEVEAHFAARYGDWILLSPRAQVAWITPVLAAIVGVLGLGLFLLRRPQPRPPVAGGESAALRQLRIRVRREVRERDA